MALVLDTSMAGAWFLPDERSDPTDHLLRGLNESSPALVPTLFWFEARNLFLTAAKRGRLRADEVLTCMVQLRGLPIEDVGTVADTAVLSLAFRRDLTAYDASYLALAIDEGHSLATLDRKMRAAATAEGVALLPAST